MSTSYADAANLPVSVPTPIVSYSPLVLDVPGRPVPLELKVSMPASGTNLPVILFAHGHGQTTFVSSLRGYGPLVDFWAVHPYTGNTAPDAAGQAADDLGQDWSFERIPKIQSVAASHGASPVQGWRRTKRPWKFVRSAVSWNTRSSGKWALS